MTHHTCALCPQRATVYCKNDAAYLCAQCDGEAHIGPLASRHERVALAECKPEAANSAAHSTGAPLVAGASVPSLPSLDLLLDMNTSVDGAAQLGGADGAQDDLLASLFSFDDPMSSFDFNVDLSELMPEATDPTGGSGNGMLFAEPPAVAATAPVPSPASLAPPAMDLFCCTTSSSADDAVVPVLPSSPSSGRCPQFLPSEPSSPLSPRLVTTGAAPYGKQQAAMKQQVPAMVPAMVPSWGVVPSVSVKPEPVTTNVAGAVGGSAAAQRKREASFLPGAPRATAKLARMASEVPDVGAVPAGIITTRAGAAAAADATVHMVPTHHMVPTAAGVVPTAAVPAPVARQITTPTGTYIDTETRADKLARYRAKKARRTFQKTIRYQTRKDYAEVRPRIKGRFVSPEEYAAYKAQQAAEAAGEADHVVPTLKAR